MTPITARPATFGWSRSAAQSDVSSAPPARNGHPRSQMPPAKWMAWMVDYKRLGGRIRQARLDRGLTQAELAELADVSTPYVSHVERGAFQLPHPMRGATHNLAVLEKRMFISTPAPAWGATPYTVEQMRYLVFQLSHPVRGATRHKPSHLVLVTFQLPHPVRGATQTIMCFPPHIQKLAIKFFNSRTPRGVRPGSAWIQTGFSHFNSRTRAGCDNTDRSSLHNGLVFSTHAPHEGCDCL